jgi:hypothetical protein
MKRRNILLTLGAVSGGVTLASATGAFTSVQANRDISVAVADDSEALLAIDDTGNANQEYVTDDGGTLGIDVSGSNPTSAGGSGVNRDAVTVFADLFRVENRGTQEVEVEVDPLTFVETSSGDTLVALIVPQTDFPTVNLTPGTAETYSLIVDDFSPDGSSLDVSDTITISAEAI